MMLEFTLPISLFLLGYLMGSFIRKNTLTACYYSGANMGADMVFQKVRKMIQIKEERKTKDEKD